MQIKLRKLLPSLKTKKYLVCLLALILICSSARGLNAATLNDLKVDQSKIVLDVRGLDKIKLVGNNSKNLTIVLPATSLKNIYAFDIDNLVAQIKSFLPDVISLQVVQYSLDPAESRIILQSNSVLKSEVTQDEDNGKVFISFESKNIAYQKLLSDIPKPELKKKVNYGIIKPFIFNSITESTEKALEDKITGNVLKAKEYFKSTYNDTPEDFWAGYYYSMMLIKEGDISKAKTINEKILKENPNFFVSYYAMGIINDIEEKTDEAIKMYKEATRIFPDHLQSHYRSGLAYLKNQDYQMAKMSFKRTLDIYPEHSGASQNLGLIFIKEGNIEEAKNYLLASLRADSLNNLGNLYLKEDKANEAIKYFNFALNLDKDNAILNYNLARSYQLLNENEKAIVYYRKTLQLKPDMFNAHYNLAVIYTNMKKKDEAVEEFFAYLDKNPDAEDAGEVNNLISQLKNLKND